MDEGKGWLRTHWRTAAILVLIFGLALFLRLYFVYGLAFPATPGTCDANYTPPYSGGSDSYYWDRALCYSFQTGKDLGTDPMLNYPIGMSNPRPPLFPWFSLLTGRLFAPLFATGWDSVLFVFVLSTGLFGALTVFPTYALAKEAFGRRTGLVAALLLAVSVGHLQRSASTDADHDAFTLFFVVATFYFFLRSLKAMQARRWVENWFRRDAIGAGVRAFFRENRTSVLYALMAGLCVTVIALSWQGWAYVSVILLVWFAAELFLDRFRNADTMGTWILFTIVLATPVVLAFQWYYARNQIRVWYDVPAYLFLASIVLGLAFTVTRDYPWTLVIPSTLIAGALGLAVGVLVNPTLASAFVTGAGYFIQSKVVTTIAEDQAPGMSQMILSFGLFTFGMSLVAIAYLVWEIPRRRDPAYNIVVIWALAAIFMAITAARFIFNASPAFAITAAFAVDLLLVRVDFAGMWRTYRSLSEGSWRNAIRKSVKFRHILAAFGIVFLVLLPNVWYGVDAAIPFDVKTQYDRQIASLLPSWLQAPGYTPSSNSPFYFGAFGYNLPKATDYYPAAWTWFRTQDLGDPPELRPAFLSWWDYGFEAVDRGAHPTVADNFQNGYPLAGQFLTAQNETQGIALLTVRLLEGNYWQNRASFAPAVVSVFDAFGLPADVFAYAISHRDAIVPIVLANPVTYGVWDPNMHGLNAQYIYLTNLLTRRFNEDGMVALYHAVRDATGRDIGYFAVDARLFPISVSNTGIFYAPVKLSDHRILQLPDGRVLPFEYFQIYANTNRGNNIPIQFVSPGDQISSQTIQYQPAFYNSMFYRAYVGYSPTDLGVANDTGIPGFDQALQSDPPVPAWNLTHWRVVYRTAYYNPFPDVANHTIAWQAMNFDQARRLQTDIAAGKAKGVVDQSTQSTVANGVVFLRYYDGALVNGTVTADSAPLPGVRITVTDELGTPHYVTRTDARGHYSAIVPFGNVTITASIGDVTRTTLVGARTLASVTLPVTVDQAMRVPADENGDSVLDWIITRNLRVAAHVASGTAFFDLNRDGAFDAEDAVVPGATVRLTDKDFPYNQSATTAADGTYSIPSLPEGRYSVAVVAGGRTLATTDMNIATTDATQNVAVPYGTFKGVARSSLGGAVATATVEVRDETNRTTITFPAGSDGAYSARPLLAGNYTVTAASGDLASLPVRLRASGTDLWLNLTLFPSGTVTGTTTLFGTARPFASLQFQAAADPETIRTASSDVSARYSIRLPAGEWFVSGRFYDGTTLYSALGRVVVSTGTTTLYDPMFLQGVRIDGTVSDPNPAITDPRATVAFSNAAGQLWLKSGTAGGYLAFLPTGSYDVEAFNEAGAAFLSATLTTSRRFDLRLLATSEVVNWAVYRDGNGNGGVDAGEAIGGARVDLMDNLGAEVVLTTNSSGEFPIPLFANRTYTGVVTAAGYAPTPIAASSPVQLRTLMPIALTPVPVQVQGSVLLNGSALLTPEITVRAIAVGGGIDQTALTDPGGGYGMSLTPGTYDLVVDQNVSTTRDWRYQNLGSDRIVIAVGAGSLSHDIDIAARTLVRGNVTIGGNRSAARLTFDGPELRHTNATSSGFEAYLIPGNYSVTGNRTIATDQYAFVETATVPTPTNLAFALIKATRITGRAVYNDIAVSGPMPLTFDRFEGGRVSVSTDVFGAYTAFLVPGNYTVTLTGTNNASEGDVTRYYRYEFTGFMSVPPGLGALALDLDVFRFLDNTTLAGTASLSGAGVDARVTFTARGGGALNATASADTTGTYSVSLAPGSYDVYATRAVGNAVYLARISVPHATSIARDVPLVNGFLLSGITTDSRNVRISVPITIRATAQLDLTSDGTGAYAAVLPPETYTLTATKSGVENGISVTYRVTASVAMIADRVVNLVLEKVPVRSAVLTWDASQRREIPAGGSVTYTLVVRNSGNLADTFEFSGRPSGWQFSFAPSSASLGFGVGGNSNINSTVLLATIQSPAGALVDHGTISIVATSQTDGSTVGSVDVQVDILRTRGIAISLDATTATFDGRFLNDTLVIRNSGNAPESVSVTITNADDLAAVGWSARLGTIGGTPTGTSLASIDVPANSTTSVRLQARSAGGASGATAVVVVSAEDSMAVSATGIFVLQLPQIASGGASVAGPNVAREPPLNLTLVAVVIGAASAIATGLFLTRRRR